jgi:hypothetical protein
LAAATFLYTRYRTKKHHDPENRPLHAVYGRVDWTSPLGILWHDTYRRAFGKRRGQDIGVGLPWRSTILQAGGHVFAPDRQLDL